MSQLHLQKKIWKGLFSWNILSLCICTIVDVFLSYIVTFFFRFILLKPRVVTIDIWLIMFVNLNLSFKNDKTRSPSFRWLKNFLVKFSLDPRNIKSSFKQPLAYIFLFENIYRENKTSLFTCLLTKKIRGELVKKSSECARFVVI